MSFNTSAATVRQAPTRVLALPAHRAQRIFIATNAARKKSYMNMTGRSFVQTAF